MWRQCDLHTHTTPDDTRPASSPEDLVRGAIESGVDVMAVTDHDSLANVPIVVEAARGTSLVVIPGLEVTTNHGHLLALSPGDQGVLALQDFVARAGVAPGAVLDFHEVVSDAREGVGVNSGSFAETLLLIGGHVDQHGSLLAAPQPLDVSGQLSLATELDALEVVNDAIREEWLVSGIKQSNRKMPFLRGSDSHHVDDARRTTWLYLPATDLRAFLQALSVPESSIRFDAPGGSPRFVIETVAFEGGLHDGMTFRLSQRATALIGPPLSGKSLIIDAIRFVFGTHCDIPEIAEVCNARLRRALGEGSIVRVTGRADGQPFQAERSWGGTQSSEPPFRPIIFSQTELVRRGMEARPAMALLDLHCPTASGLRESLARVQGEILEVFGELVAQAANAKALHERVANEVDGLVVTRNRIDSLAGTESVARRATEIARVRDWRQGVKDGVAAWRDAFTAPGGPAVSPPPKIDDAVLDAGPFTPLEGIERSTDLFRRDVDWLAGRLADNIIGLLEESEGTLAARVEELTEALTREGYEEGSAVLAELRGLRTRLQGLEQNQHALQEAEQAIDAGLLRLRGLVDEARGLVQRLREDRVAACARVNASMRTFFARLDYDARTSDLDRLLEDAKVGTFQWTKSIPDVRTALDRSRLLEAAIRHAQGRDDLIADAAGLDQQDAISRTAVGRSTVGLLPRIATTWPDDALVLATKEAPQERFENLAEGLRALAIKEISFAASDLPVISDQPEDAVPPQNVFLNLVPTLRRQREQRQFILASHDANIVVASDVEQIVVLHSGEPPVEGSLFDEQVREAAMEILEGGRDAFVLRGDRYKRSR